MRARAWARGQGWWCPEEEKVEVPEVETEPPEAGAEPMFGGSQASALGRTQAS